MTVQFRIIGPPTPMRRPLAVLPASYDEGVSTRAAATLARIDAALARSTHAVEHRAAATLAEAEVDVDRTARTIRLVAVPWGQPTLVPFRGGVWTETFSPGAFVPLDGRVVRVNRDHDRTRTVGKIVDLDVTDPRGLVATIYVVRTVLGDEALQLAAEDCLSASVGFGVPPGGEVLDVRAKTRRITAAVLDHLSLVADPAYAGATVLTVG